MTENDNGVAVKTEDAKEATENRPADEAAVNNGAKKNAETAKPASADDIIRQVEHYFGDYNLPKDRFLQELVKEDDGWITMETMLKFKRLASLSTDPKFIMASLKTSTSGLMEVDEEKDKIRRSPTVPVPEWDEDRKKELFQQTLYVKGFNLETTTLESLNEFFGKDAGVMNLHMRTYVDKKDDNKKKFKGSVFVTFKTKEQAEKYMALESVKIGEEEAIRKWQKDYFEEKRKEFVEKKEKAQEFRHKLKQAKQGAGDKKEEEKEQEEEMTLPKGTVLLMTGLEPETMREDIKAKLTEEFEGEEISYIYFQKGDKEAKLRFKNADGAIKTAEKMAKADKIEIKGATVTYRVFEGEEEDKFLKQCVADMKERKNMKRGHKRKGGNWGGGYKGKRSRN